MQPTVSPFQHSLELDLLARYEKKMLRIVKGKIRPDIFRDIVLTFNEIHPTLVANARFRGKRLPQQEDAILLKTETLINLIRSLGQPVPEELFEIQDRYKLLPDCDPSCFKQKCKEVEVLVREHHIDMEMLATSASRFDAKLVQIERRAKNILARLDALINEVRPRTALAKQLKETGKCIREDLFLRIARRKFQQRHPSFLCCPSPLTTAAPTASHSLNNTLNPTPGSGLTTATVSVDSH